MTAASTLHEDIVDDSCQANSAPATVSLYGDLNGQINALDLGEKPSSNALLDEYGDATSLHDCARRS